MQTYFSMPFLNGCHLCWLLDGHWVGCAACSLSRVSLALGQSESSSHRASRTIDCTGTPRGCCAATPPACPCRKPDAIMSVREVNLTARLLHRTRAGKLLYCTQHMRPWDWPACGQRGVRGVPTMTGVGN